MSDLVAECFWSKVEKQADGCWIWQGSRGKHGYGMLTVNGKGWRAHRYALELAGKPPPSKTHFACHSCDTPLCVNPEHLWWGTPHENSLDAAKKGRMARGERHGRAKLTEADVHEIRAGFTAGIHDREQAKRFGVSYDTIRFIKYGRLWSHV